MSIVSCAFNDEIGTCGWHNLANSDFQWIEGGFDYFDSSGGVNEYLSFYANTQDRLGKKSIVLESPLIYPEADLNCFKFTYWMEAEDLGELNIKLIGHKSGLPAVTDKVWKVEQMALSNWQVGSVQVIDLLNKGLDFYQVNNFVIITTS